MLKDEQFERGNVPMTKEEVRAVIMAKAAVGLNSKIIDIGAGTGSLAIQAALLAKTGQVVAIEKEPEAINLLKANCLKHQVKNLQVLEMAAPEGLAGLGPADIIFIGGSGGKLADIISKADHLLVNQGRMIIPAVTLATLSEAIDFLTTLKYRLDICQVAVTKYVPVKAHFMAKAQNPIFIITGAKERDN
jgi:precorrin-6Y C5,15-methyltransferase (decarboxylating) CbiT subunit